MKAVFGIRFLYCSKLAINRKDNNGVTICQYDVIVIFFDVVLFLLSNLVTGPSFMYISSLVLESMTIYVYKGLTRNLEIENNPV